MALKKRSELAAPYHFRTWRDFTPMSVSVGAMLHNRTGGWRFIRPIYEDKTPACQNACPAGCDIERWVGLVQKQAYDKACRHLRIEQPFPAILGRVCFRFCEGACNREPLDVHVNINALERFLRDLFPSDETLPDLPDGRVVVIGGGNTAVDAARTAVRLGCETTILYRRSEEEMPAHPGEAADAVDEGVRLALLAAPERIELDDAGGVRKLICCEMALGEPDESGSRRPEKKDGALFEMEVDSIVTAIGEAPDLGCLDGEVKTDRGMALVDDALKALDEKGEGGKIFAGGDMTAGPRTVVHAVAAGKRAAIAMDCDKKGLDVAEVLSSIAAGDGSALRFSAYMGWEPEAPASRDPRKVVGRDRIVYDYFRKAPAIRVETSDHASRKRIFQDYRRTYTEKEARAEVDRCMHCGRCTECDNCLIFCPDMSVLPHEDGRFGYAIDYDYCKGCGVCHTECLRDAITMIDEETLKEVI